VQADATGDVASGLAADDSKVFITQCVRGRVGMADASVAGAVDVSWIIRDLNCPQAATAAGGWLYWVASYRGAPVIGRARYDGSATDDDWLSLRGREHSVGGLAVADGHLYWIASAGLGRDSHIGRVDLGGTNVETPFLRAGDGAITSY
jgi:hypothetical protein